MGRLRFCLWRPQFKSFNILWLALVLCFLGNIFPVIALTIPHVGNGTENTLNSQLRSERVFLFRRYDVPSVPFIRDKVIAGGQMENKVSIFWSGFHPPPEGFKAAKFYGEQMIGCGKYALYNQALPNSEWGYFSSVNPDDPPTPQQKTQKVQVMSAVFAQTSSGVAYVLVQDGKPFDPDSTWINYEYPNLTAPGSAVTAVILLWWPSMTQQRIWQTGDPQQGVWPPIGAPWSIFEG